jgi:hypothetical protein
MVSRKTYGALLIVLVLFLTVTAIRFSLSLQSPEFASAESYYHLRQVDSILTTGSSITYDSLSYGGRDYSGIALYDYVLTASVGNTLFLKFIGSLLGALLTLVIYFYAREFTSDWYAVLSASAAGFIPVYFSSTIADVSILVLFVPLFWFCLWCFHTARAKLFLLSLLVLTLLSPYSMIIPLTLALYLLAYYLDKLEVGSEKKELAAFSILFVTYAYCVLYSTALQTHGPAAIWSNIPRYLLSDYFSQMTFSVALASIGFVPFIFGLFVFHAHFTERRHSPVWEVVCAVFVIGILFITRIIPIDFALSLLGSGAALLLGRGYYLFSKRFHQTKISYLATGMHILLITLFILTSVLSSVVSADVHLSRSYQSEDFEALLFINKNTPQHSVVLGLPEEGSIIQYVANRSTVMDSNYLLAPEVDTRYYDTQRMFISPVYIEAIELLESYDVSYVYLSSRARFHYGISDLRYARNNECFAKVFENTAATIYQRNPECKVTTIER